MFMNQTGCEQSMLIEHQCIPCLANQIVRTVHLVSSDRLLQDRMLRELLGILADFDPNKSAPEHTATMQQRLSELSGGIDPFKVAKQQLNELAKSLLPDLEAQMSKSEDPFEFAVRCGVAANAMDLGLRAEVSKEDVSASLKRGIEEPLSGDFPAFKEAVHQAQNILFLTDNTGEVVIDRLLLQQLQGKNVTIVTRGGPILNDALLEDAQFAGLDELFPIINSGLSVPGTVLEDSSATLQAMWKETDLIISKGQGNYETLSDTPGPVWFLFQVKCSAVSTRTGQPQGTHMVMRSPVHI